VLLKRGAGHLSVQSGDISYTASESDVEILMSRDGNDVVSQSASTYGSHDDSSHQQQVRFYEYFCVQLTLTVKRQICLILNTLQAAQ